MKIDLQKNLRNLGISIFQLVDIGILIGIFLESKSKKELTNFLYQNNIEGYFHTFVFNIHNITYRIPPELKYNSTQLKVINDIFLEYGNLEFEMYNLKIYHKRSEGGISSIRNKISDLIKRYFGIQLELNEIRQRYELSFPKITNYYGNVRDQVYLKIYFVQNFPPIYTHDNIYFRINHRQNEQIFYHHTQTF